MASAANHRPRKRFGQNFLRDSSVIDRIVSSIAASKSDHLVEIGPGQAALTRPLLKPAGQLDVVEIDRDLAARLSDDMGHQDHFRLFTVDALKFDFCQLVASGRPLRIVGNLPYNISTPILFHLTKQRHCVQDLHLMLQKEVVERMAAAPGSRIYGRLSVMLQIAWQITPLFQVSPASFFPPPKVDSSVVRLTRLTEPPAPIKDELHFARIVGDAFAQRRKTIRNSLKNHISATELQALDIDPIRRPETLSIDEFARISNFAEGIHHK
ncbi:MAG: 16S rRNA (adenine(1518)-N(6)/adenine(1519)-N(6))-dimethyltransferase RsmA [gamma proteobacterium symbiont of Bathyaustriella thionipta]|nr:16S rRNA (adenine(1518)-N(6)/adenine(1519)-N(6))-dimethyltransferase RsmA [gamma proteobacterium symbiont of Bathyaustriella thionipta]